MRSARLRAAVLLGIMLLGSLAMWIVVPLLCLRLSSLVVNDSQASLWLTIFIYPVAAILLGTALYGLQASYYELRGRPTPRRAHTAYLKSVSAERTSKSKHGILDAMLALSCLAAVVAAIAWFSLFATNFSPPFTL